MSERIYIVDDDPDIVQFVRINLELEGYVVESSGNAPAALAAITKNPPDLVIVDIMMPGMDGLTLLKRLRTHPATVNALVIVLTARSLPTDRIAGLEIGADDYIAKPFDLGELLARVRAVLQRGQALRDLSPLTGLPGNFRITQELERRVASQEPFGLIHADLDNFKAYNDHYGFMRGDGVIKFTAHALLETKAELGDNDLFVGHIGGDDFVIMLKPDQAESFCKTLIRIYDEGVLDFYDTADVLRGYIEVIDRRGERHAFPLSTISMGVVTSLERDLRTHWEASAIASEMKEYAKRQPGSAYSMDRRST